MSDYELYEMSAVGGALKHIRAQYLAKQSARAARICVESGKHATTLLHSKHECPVEPLVWTGPDRLHFHVAAGSPPPSWHFSEEGMAHHADQGRHFWDVYALVAFQIGFHNGVVRMEPEVEEAREQSRRWSSLFRALMMEE